ncbi:MAG: iron ABC transporter permease [Treponema sp.]|nr:iron ABC transporter permease [Treponema sp.]
MKLPEGVHGDYGHYIWKKWMALFIIAACLFGGVVVSLSVGSSGIGPAEIVRALFGRGLQSSRTIIWNIRMPRIATAITVGMALAMAGCIMQNLLRNPLASASTLGITQGATFGAAVSIIYFQGGAQVAYAAANPVTFTNPYSVVLFAFIGGISTTILILLLARVIGVTPSVMILAGVAISAMFTGATALIQYFSDDVRIASVVYWTFGNLGRAGWSEILLILGVSVAAFFYFMYNRWNYNAMESGTSTAKSLGVNVNLLILAGMIIATLVSATAIAFVGTINFIGLIAPHIVRRFTGNDYRFLIPASALMGALVMLLSDICSRILFPPAVLPIGALTSFLGAPLFLYMIIKKGNIR